MPKTRWKKAKPVKAWGIVDKQGYLVKETERTSREAVEMLAAGDIRVTRVEIREI